MSDREILPQLEQPLGWRPERALTHAIQIDVRHHSKHNPTHQFRQSNNYKVTCTIPVLPESCVKLIQVPFLDFSGELEEVTEESDTAYAPLYLNPNTTLKEEAGTAPVEAADLAHLDKESHDICELC